MAKTDIEKIADTMENVALDMAELVSRVVKLEIYVRNIDNEIEDIKDKLLYMKHA